MSFAAPVVARTAATTGSAAAAGSSAAGAKVATTGRRKLASTGEPAAAALARRRAQRSSTAASRADELVGAGGPRYRQRRVLRDEFGATAAEADDLLDAAASRRPEPEAVPDEPAPRGTADGFASKAGAAVGGQLGRGAGTALNAGGGLLLGVIAYVLGVNYLRDGSTGVKKWLRAKFLNRVDAPSSTASKDRSAFAAAGAQRATAGSANTGSGLRVSTDGGAGASGQGVSNSGGGGW